MEIIKDNYNSFNVTCDHCKSILSVSIKDISRNDVYSDSINCAACHKVHFLKTKDIPARIRNQLD